MCSDVVRKNRKGRNAREGNVPFEALAPFAVPNINDASARKHVKAIPLYELCTGRGSRQNRDGFEDTIHQFSASAPSRRRLHHPSPIQAQSVDIQLLKIHRQAPS